MEPKDFLSAALGTDGYYCVVGIKDKKRVVPKFCLSIDEVHETASAFDSEGFDTFVALATFVTNESRKADNVLGIKTLFLDIDCGEGKPYATQREGWAAVQALRAKYGLPECSVVVNSGRGLHVYWILDATYTREQWLPVAEQLKATCMEAGLHIDPAVTADAARVLRVPNTHNYKGNVPKLAKIINANPTPVSLSDFASKLPAVSIPVLPLATAREYTEADAKDMARALGDNKYIKKFSKLLKATAVGKGCAQIHRAIMTPDELSYPDWLHVLSIAKFCDDDGAQAIHLVSQGYSNYSAEETEKIAASIDTPHLCSTFERDNPAGCEGCPHKLAGTIRSPIKLCMEVRTSEEEVVEVKVPVPKNNWDEEEAEHYAQQEDEDCEDGEGDPNAPQPPPESTLPAPFKTVSIQIPKYPFPYERGATGGVYVRIKHPDGTEEQKEIYKRDLYVTKRLLDPIEGPAFEFKHHTTREGVQTFVISMNKITSKEEFRKVMGMHDIFVLAKQADALMTYIGRWIETLKDSQDIINVHTQFGWTEDRKSFVLGEREIFADRVTINPPSVRTAQYFPFFHKKGTLEGWKKVTGYYNREGFEEHQYMFAIAFGSPLMIFIPNIAGSIYHLMSSDSGYGKTTGMNGGASVWGNYKKLVLKGKDTGNSAWNRAEIWKNLPLYIDEITNYKPADASEFTYAVSDGEQKNRMSNTGQNAERYRGAEWAFIVGTTGNTSLADIVSQHRALAKGEIGRMLEGTVIKTLKTTEDAMKANILNEDLSNNYGHAGEVFIQHVLNHMVEVEKLVLATRDKLMVSAGLEAQHRFWVAQTATTFAACIVTNQLGLTNWDLQRLYRWIVRKLKKAREDMKDMVIDIEDLVGQYLSDNPRGILRLKSTDSAKTKDAELEKLILPDATPMFRWVARHEYDANRLFLLPTPFKEWCIKRGHHYASIRGLIKSEMNGKFHKVRLGRGTKLDLGAMHTIELTWNQSKHESVQSSLAEDDEVNGN